MNTFWKHDKVNYPFLNKNEEADVLIIGAGLAGISLAYELKDTNKKIIVVDKGIIGGGVTGNTTAHITLQHDLIYHNYIKKFGVDKTTKILQANIDAINKIESNIKENKIECDFERQPDYLIAYSKKTCNQLKKEYNALKKCGHSCKLIEQEHVTLVNEKQALFHPIKYLHGLATSFVASKGIIYENSKVIKVHKNRVYFDKYYINAKKIVVATHNPIINTKGFYFTRLHYDKSYAVQLADESLPVMMNEMDGARLTYRKNRNCIIVGGQDHMLGHQSKRKHFNKILNSMDKEFLGTPNAYYSASDGITLDKLPYIGQYSRFTKNLFVITGFNKWGMTNSVIAANVIKSLICNEKNELIHIYSPQRKRNYTYYFHALYRNTIMFSQFLYWIIKPTNKVCTHLGCKLLYNDEENKYECPCHGSRFNETGEVIDGPAIKNL